MVGQNRDRRGFPESVPHLRDRRLHIARHPNIPGRQAFSGTAMHSSRWDHTVDLRGKRVAVIGTGASAVKFIPQIASDVEHLDVFQRTPSWIVPKADRAFTTRQRRLRKLGYTVGTAGRDCSGSTSHAPKDSPRRLQTWPRRRGWHVPIFPTDQRAAAARRADPRLRRRL